MQPSTEAHDNLIRIKQEKPGREMKSNLVRSQRTNLAIIYSVEAPCEVRKAVRHRGMQALSSELRIDGNAFFTRDTRFAFCDNTDKCKSNRLDPLRDLWASHFNNV